MQYRGRVVQYRYRVVQKTGRILQYTGRVVHFLGTVLYISKRTFRGVIYCAAASYRRCWRSLDLHI